MVMSRYPGYTLGALMAEDFPTLWRHLALLDPDFGKVDDG